MKDVQNKILNLTARLIEASDAYYNTSESLMTDREYDMALKELAQLEKDFPQFAVEGSPTGNVGAPTRSTFEKITHEIPMLSLDNTYNKGDLEAFVSRVKKIYPKAIFAGEPKYDGVSISLEYNHGKLIRAITRGNGVIGEDVTENIKQIDDVPHLIEFEGSITVRGEVLMSKEVFKKLNEERQEKGLPLYMNPRNTVSGTIRQHDVSVVRSRKLETRMYYVYGADSIVNSQFAALKFLTDEGFHVGELYDNLHNADDMIKCIDKFDSIREKLPIETDGMVFKVTEINKWGLIGFTGRAPKWAIAYKYDTEKALTKLNKVIWQVGRTGKLTPVAEFDLVYLAGTNVNRSTLHNMDQIRAKDLRIGDTIVVEKAAEIIPQVVEAQKFLRTGDEIVIEEPTVCPICGSPVIKIEKKVDIFCCNWDCPCRLAIRLEHFVSRDAINIKYMGPAIIKSLVDEGVLTKITDVYKLVELYKDSPFGYHKGISEEIEKSKQEEPSGLLYGMGIHAVGKSTAKKLIKAFGSIENIFLATDKELIKVVGNAVIKSLREWYETPKNKKLLDELESYGVNTVCKECDSTGSTFAGKTFVITGSLSLFKNRDELVEFLENHGARVTNSVTKNTTALIAGENAGSKLSKAMELKIDIMNEQDIYALYLSVTKEKENK